MALKDLFDMVKADRYTADGREALIKAQEAETEDKTYQIGEISQKTGLQKTANGWVKPKNGKQPGAKENGPLSPAKRKAERIAKMQKETGKEAPYGRTLKGTPKTPDDNPLTERTQTRAAAESKPTDETDSAGNKRPSTDVAYLKGSKDPQLKADVKKAIATHHATGNNLLNVLYNKDKELYKKLDAMGTTNAEQFINQLAHDSAPRVLTGDTRIRVRKA